MTLSMLTNRLRHRGLWLFALLVTAALMLSACDLVGDDSDDEEQQQQAMQEQAQQEEPAAAAAPARPAAQPPREEEGPEPPPQAAGGGEGADAYSIVFPSLAFVMTPNAVATGLVIADGYVIIDERALGGAMAADVLLSNGDTLTALAVVGRDRFTGLAYLGPLDPNFVRRLPGARLGDGEGIRPGSSVFTIGYAVGDHAESLPSVYSGVLSGFDQWDVGERTFLRTDARPPGATAGMVLVDGSGTVIGIAPAAMVGLGWYVSTGDLARSLPPEPIVPARAPDPATASTEHVVAVSDIQHSASLYVADDLTGEAVSLSIAATTPALLQLIDANGEVLQDSNVIVGSTILSLAPSTVGPYRVVIIPDRTMQQPEEDAETGEELSEAMDSGSTYRITSSAPLMSIAETDEMTPPELNAPFVGTIDIAGDEDSFNLPVRAGAVYEIRARSLLFDTVLFVEGAGLDAVDDDSGGGPFGRDSLITLEPEEDGIVRLTIKDYADEGTGAYVLTITQVGGETPEEAAAMAEEEEAMAAVVLPNPAPPPAVSLRGIGGDEGLQATLLGLNSQSEGNGLLVEDADGAFEIIVSVIGTDGALGRLTVTDAAGAIVVEGRVLVSCVGASQCLARAIFIANEAEAGIWVVALSADEPGIAEWQIEVDRHDQ